MAGYAATARLTPASIRPGPSLRSGERPIDPGAISNSTIADPRTPEAPPIPLRERVHYLREGWAQMTFYLFDPQSWR